jgi:DNA-binding protein HU-beta
MAKAATKTAVKTKAAPKPAAKAKSAVSTVTLRHIGTALSESHDLPKKQANAVLEDFVALVTKHLKKGDRIRIGGLGILQVRKRPARIGRNPATGEQIKIKASKKVAFRAAKDLKEQI